MERRRYIRLLGSSATVGVTGLAGCGSPGDGGGGDGGDDGETDGGGGVDETEAASPDAETAAEPDGGGAGSVEMITEGEEYYFDPIGVAVEPGTEVTWINESGSHSATAYVEGNSAAEVTLIPDEAEAWDSGILSEDGAEYSHTFEVEGTYDYFCIPHKTLQMVGRVVVGEPGGPAEGSQPPDGAVPESDQIVEQGVIAYDDFTG